MLERDANGDLLFPIRSSPGHYFYAGRLPEGRQALIARSVYGELIAAIFDGGGNLMQVIHQELASPPVLLDSDEIREVDEDSFQEYLQREFGFCPSLIRIKEFRIPQEKFAVYHLPQNYQEFLEDPNSLAFDDEERKAFPGLIAKWNEWGQFVLEWGNDFWLDSLGEVVAS
ncbi:MAG: hypothetical protein JO112_07110 [Planctomycetes bacterium]|nr:hypothetical protein [Planctomycetota bacterium]